MSKCFIYVLKDPATLDIKYVGQTNDPAYRLISHIAETRTNLDKCEWISRLKEQGQKPILEVIEEVKIDQSKEREIYWIEFFKSKDIPLFNKKPGSQFKIDITGRVRITGVEIQAWAVKELTLEAIDNGFRSFKSYVENILEKKAEEIKKKKNPNP